MCLTYHPYLTILIGNYHEKIYILRLTCKDTVNLHKAETSALFLKVNTQNSAKLCPHEDRCPSSYCINNIVWINISAPLFLLLSIRIQLIGQSQDGHHIYHPNSMSYWEFNNIFGNKSSWNTLVPNQRNTGTKNSNILASKGDFKLHLIQT